MKSILTALFLLIVAVVNAASIPGNSTGFDLDIGDKGNKVFYILSTLPDGQRLINIFEGSSYAGAIKEGLNEGDDITCYDPYGNALSDCDELGDEDEKDGSPLQPRQLGAAARLLRRFGGFISRWGKRAWVSLTNIHVRH